MSFNVTKPQPPTAIESGLITVRYTLDGNVSGLYFCNHYSSEEPPGISDFSYSYNLTVPDGNHILMVEADGIVISGIMTASSMDNNSTVLFGVKTQPLPQAHFRN